MHMCAPGIQPPHLRWHRVCQGTTHSFLRPETHDFCISFGSNTCWQTICLMMICYIICIGLLVLKWPTWSCMLSTRRGPGSSSNWSSSPENKCLKMRTYAFNCFDTSRNPCGAQVSGFRSLGPSVCLSVRLWGTLLRLNWLWLMKIPTQYLLIMPIRQSKAMWQCQLRNMVANFANNENGATRWPHF